MNITDTLAQRQQSHGDADNFSQGEAHQEESLEDDEEQSEEEGMKRNLDT